jgi:N6-adenosine-specific RNA methylase IME4
MPVDMATQQEDHYPTMPVSEICKLPVSDLALDNAVLFLWATSPILDESFGVIRAWGFKYKAFFVWDKVKHNMGHYNSVRAEILLVAVRGSCQPDESKLFDSVQTIERSDHSTKPEKFREIIQTLYPYGPRVELFARQEREGWVTYGNQLSR